MSDPTADDFDQGWERRADQWLAWARTPDFDAYWAYRAAFFALLPPPSGRTLDVGCGEGRVSRDLTARGYRVTGLDASPSLVRAAAALDPGGEYAVGNAEALPYEGATFSLVVAYNVLMDVGDMSRAVGEAARVLTPGGRLAVCVTHPFADATTWDDDDDDPPFVVSRSYLDGGPFEETIERAGLTMTFDGTAHPLESYARRSRHEPLVRVVGAGRRRRPGSPAPATRGWPAKHTFVPRAERGCAKGNLPDRTRGLGARPTPTRWCPAAST